jgi:hypothetical protein
MNAALVGQGLEKVAHGYFDPIACLARSIFRVPVSWSCDRWWVMVLLLYPIEINGRTTARKSETKMKTWIFQEKTYDLGLVWIEPINCSRCASKMAKIDVRLLCPSYRTIIASWQKASFRVNNEFSLRPSEHNESSVIRPCTRTHEVLVIEDFPAACSGIQGSRPDIIRERNPCVGVNNEKSVKQIRSFKDAWIYVGPSLCQNVPSSSIARCHRQHVTGHMTQICFLDVLLIPLERAWSIRSDFGQGMKESFENLAGQ